MVPLKAIDAQIADPGADLLRHGLSQRLHHGVGELHCRDRARAIIGAGKIGLASVPFGATIVIGRVSPLFCGMLP